MNIGQKIKHQRESKGFSQQEIAEKAGISIRTIQRIETNQNQPQGFTLRAICSALELSPEDLFDEHLVENKGAIQALHLLPMVGLVMPLGNILAPAVFWLMNKNKYHHLDKQAKNLLFWQSSSIAFFTFLFIFMMVTKLNHTNPFPNGDIDFGLFRKKINRETILIAILFLHYFIMSLFLPVLFTILTQYLGIKNYYPPIFKK